MKGRAVYNQGMKKRGLSPEMRRRLPALASAAVIILGFFFAGDFMAGRKNPPPRQQEQQGDIKGFRRDCVRGVLDGGAVPAACASAGAIKSAYNVDVGMLLIEDHGRLIMTARRIDRGQIMDDRDYKECLDSGDCLPLPRIPKGKNQGSPESLRIQNLLAHLVDKGSLTPEVCEALEICRAMIRAGLLKPEELDRT